MLTVPQNQDEHTRSTYAAYDITRHQRNWSIFYQYQGHVSETNCIHAVRHLKSAKICYNSSSMFQTNERAIGFTMQINAYMHWTASFDLIYTNHKLLWRNGNSKLSKRDFSFIYSSVDHSTWSPVKFLSSWVRRNKRA